MSVGWSFLSLDYNLTMLQSALENLLCLLTFEQKKVYALRAILEADRQALWLIEVLYAIKRNLLGRLHAKKIKGLNQEI